MAKPTKNQKLAKTKDATPKKTNLAKSESRKLSTKKIAPKSKASKSLNNSTSFEISNRVQALKVFYLHLAIFLPTSLFLIILNLIENYRVIWFVWPILSWGLGVFYHWLAVFFLFSKKVKNWEKLQEVKFKKRLFEKK